MVVLGCVFFFKFFALFASSEKVGLAWSFTLVLVPRSNTFVKTLNNYSYIGIAIPGISFQILKSIINKHSSVTVLRLCEGGV